MKIAEVFVEVRPDTTKFAPQVQKDTTAAATKAKSAFKGLLAGAAVGLFAKGAFSELESAQKSAKQLEQTIKSTGGAAGVTAQHASDLADAISKASTVDDDLVANTERVLLTFTEIKNVGVDKVFDRATQAAVDMAAGLGGDAQAAAIQLGKALNDPVKGITALSKAGVSFTQDQKNVIASLVATGDTAKAQGIILGELEKEFGGQAAAAATDADKARIAFANLQESVGTALAPVIADASTAVTFLSEAFSAQPPVVQQVELAALAAGVAYAKLAGPVGEAAASLRKFSIESTGIKGALGKAGLAGLALVAGLAVQSFIDRLAHGQLRRIKGDVDDIAESLASFAEGDSGAFNIDALSDAFDKLGESAGKRGLDRILDPKFWLGGQGGRSALEAAKEDIDAVDKSLAALVESGNAGEARTQFEAIAAALIAQGVSIEDINKAFDDYSVAVDKSGQLVVTAADGSAVFAEEAEKVEHHVKTAAEAVDEFNDALDEYLGKALDAEEATDRIAQGFLGLADDVKAIVDLPGKTTLTDFTGNTEAALTYRDSIRGLVDDYGTLIKTTSANKAETNLLADSFINQARAIGVPEEEVQKYAQLLRDLGNLDPVSEVRVEGILKARTDTAELAKKLGDIDGKSVRARADVDTADALRKLQELHQWLASINSLSSLVNISSSTAGTKRAGGGPVPDGFTLVGEEGPELLTKRGSQVDVLSNRRTRAALGGGGGSRGDTHIHVHGFMVATERELADRIARVLETLDS